MEHPILDPSFIWEVLYFIKIQKSWRKSSLEIFPYVFTHNKSSPISGEALTSHVVLILLNKILIVPCGTKTAFQEVSDKSQSSLEVQTL